MKAETNYIITATGVCILLSCIYYCTINGNSFGYLILGMMCVMLVLNAVAVHYRIKSSELVNKIKELHDHRHEMDKKMTYEMSRLQEDVDLVGEAKNACQILNSIRR